MGLSFDSIKKKCEKLLWKKQTCARCGQAFRFPLNRGKLKIKCPACKQEYLFDPDMIQVPNMMRNVDSSFKKIIPRKFQINIYGKLHILLNVIYMIYALYCFAHNKDLSVILFLIVSFVFYYAALAFDANKKIGKYSFYTFLFLLLITNIFDPTRQNTSTDIPQHLINKENSIDI